MICGDRPSSLDRPASRLDRQRIRRRSVLRELISEYEDTLANPYMAADRGYVDAVIPPSHTRVHIVRALRAKIAPHSASSVVAAEQIEIVGCGCVHVKQCA